MRRVRTLGPDLSALRQAIRKLQRAMDRMAAQLNGSPSPRRKLELTPARRSQLKLQGQYMGYLRNLKPTQKSRVKTARTTKGIRAAIALAKRLAKGA